MRQSCLATQQRSRTLLHVDTLLIIVANSYTCCRSKTFDAAADGYGRGEGCIVFVLRRSAGCDASSEPLAVLHGTALSAVCSRTAQPQQGGHLSCAPL